MKKLNFLIDENIPLAEKLFSRIGRVICKSSSEINKGQFNDIDVLAIRSRTKVNKSLLNGSKVKFVGTATAGTDHIDLLYLKKNGIGFSDAAGSNARSVVEYILAVLFHYCAALKKDINRLSLGIVGTGNIGGELADRAEKLGIKVLRNDPPLQEKGVKAEFYKLNDLLEADIITIHTPLTMQGKYPTYHLFNRRILDKINKNTLLINASRGAVVDNTYLLHMLETKKIKRTVLDVWESEPAIEPRLLEKVYLGTPHIAGYSFDGKVKGTVMLFNKICEYFQINSRLDIKDLAAPIENNIIDAAFVKSPEITIHNTIKKVYDIEKDFTRMKKMIKMNDLHKRADFFNQLRKEYPVRREFYNYTIRLNKKDSSYQNLGEMYLSLGFKLFLF